MTNSNAELIERSRKYLEELRSGNSLSIRTEGINVMVGVISALESQPFDVLQHLRDGGKIVSEQCNTAAKDLTERSHIWYFGREFTVFDLISDGPWQPHHEPREPGFYAVLKNKGGAVYPWHFDGHYFTYLDKCVTERHLHWISDKRIELDEPEEACPGCGIKDGFHDMGCPEVES